MRNQASDTYFNRIRPSLDEPGDDYMGFHREPLPLSNLQPLVSPPLPTSAQPHLGMGDLRARENTLTAKPKIRSAREVRLGKKATLQKVGAAPGSTHISPATTPAQGLSILELLRKLQSTQSGATPDPAKPKPLSQRRSKVTGDTKSGFAVLRTKTRRSKNSLIN